MKVYCSGPGIRFGLGFIRDKIDEYMASGAQIFVSDCNIGAYELQTRLADAHYENVRVVFYRDLSEYEEWPSTNKGDWEYKEYVRRQHDYAIDPLIELDIAGECDEGFFVWDKKDIEVYVSILVFLALGKSCEIYLEDEDKIICLSSLEELQPYILKEKESAVLDGDIVNKDFLVSLQEIPESLRRKLCLDKDNKVNIHKHEVKKEICKSSQPLKEKLEVLKKLYDEENLFSELLLKTIDWRNAGGSTQELRLLINENIQHSFRTAYLDMVVANSWIDHTDGSNEDVILYVFERFAGKDGKINDIPVGVYTDINLAVEDMGHHLWENNGCKIEVWERNKYADPYIQYKHKLNFYCDYKDICWFEFMRLDDLINDCDPFEPLSYTPKNNHYYGWDEWHRSVYKDEEED